MSARGSFPPVLALGTSRVCLAIARSLARHGVAVDVATDSASDPVRWSRAVRAVHNVPGFYAGPGRFLDSLLALLKSGKYEMVMPASDSALAAISRFYEPLREHTRLCCPPPAVLERVLRKDETLRIARSCGVPAPPTWQLDEVKAAGRGDLPFPLIAKPKAKFSEGSFKTRRLENLADLHEAFPADDGSDREILLQAYCPGEGVGVETLFVAGEPLVLFQHRRLKEFPYGGGVSVLAVSEPVDPQLADYSVRLLRAMEWEGAAMVEFRQDRSSGTAALMEVNGRLWGSLPLSTQAGVDFPYYCWQTARGERPTPPEGYSVGLRARWAAGDLQRIGEIFARSRGDATFRKMRWRELGRFCAEFGPGVNDMVWSWSDPGPAVRELSHESVALVKSSVEGLVRKVIPRARKRQ